MSPDRSRIVHFTDLYPYNRGESGDLNVSDLLPDGKQAKYKLVHGCENRFGFKIAIAALPSQYSKRSVEQCSSRAVGFERVLKSDKKRKPSSSGRSSREVQSGCTTSGNKNECSEATVFMLFMRVEDDFVAELAKNYLMECCRVANFQDRVLVAAVTRMTGVVTVLDALTSEVVNDLRIEPKVVCSLAASQRKEEELPSTLNVRLPCHALAQRRGAL
jgi:hypothetical protein